MTTTTIVSELTLAHIALDLDAPATPLRQPPDPAHAVLTCRQYLARCQKLLYAAQTAQEQREAELWVMNAERQLTRWQAALDRQAVQP